MNQSLTGLRKRLDEATSPDEAEVQFDRIAKAVAGHYPRVRRVRMKDGRLLSMVARVPEDQFPSRAAVELYNQSAFPVTPKGEAILNVWGNIGNSSQKSCEFVAGLLTRAGIACRVTKYKGDHVVAFVPLDRGAERISEARGTSVASALAGLGFVNVNRGGYPGDGHYKTDDGGPVDTMQLHRALVDAGLKMDTQYRHHSMRGREFPMYSSYSREQLGGGTTVTLHWATEGDPEFTKGVTVHSYMTRD